MRQKRLIVGPCSGADPALPVVVTFRKMLRAIAVVLFALAYLAGTGHCALTETLCAKFATCAATAGNGGNATIGTSAGEVSMPAHSHSEDHLPHGDDCNLDGDLRTPPPAPPAVSAPKPPAGNATGGAENEAFFGAAFCVWTLAPPAAQFASPLAPPAAPANASPHERSALAQLAHGWQFLERAAPSPRAP